MLSSISRQPRLKDLKTRDDFDLSIGLIDSWALVADIITFYQERIANEGFLRTATERWSILELSRSIGYELKPGVSASVDLAFYMDTAVGSPKTATIGVGTKVQSVPAQNELPQVFETVEEIEAHQAWNEVKPQQEVKQNLQTALTKGELVLAGTSTRLKAGDGLLFVISAGSAGAADETRAAFVIANSVEIDPQHQKTKVLFAIDSVSSTPVAFPSVAHKIKEKESEANPALSFDGLLRISDISDIAASSWAEPDLQSKASLKDWSMDNIVDAINSERKRKQQEADNDHVYAFRVKCGVFGNAAPKWNSLPPEQRYNYPLKLIAAPYPVDWDEGNGIPINKDSSGDFYGENGYLFYLDNAYQNIQPVSWIVLANSSKVSGFLVTKTSEASITGYAMTGKVTGLTISSDKSSGWIKFSSAAQEENILGDLEGFYFRSTTVYAAPEKLEIADVAVEIAVHGSKILLDSMVGNLKLGRPVAISGELEDQPGIIKREIAFLSNIIHFEDGKLLTTVDLSKPLLYKYKRNTVKINFNVARANHGETKEVSIGSGDPSQRFQELSLKHSSLTYISAPDRVGGIESTLDLTIEGIKWDERESFEGLGPSDRSYITHRSDDGKTTIVFGDGKTGRLPSAGQENVRARYRVGIGSAGLLDADQLSILLTRPLGVRSVTNPHKTSGAEDPEGLDGARTNAPRVVLTMDRLVSLEDYKNFAQSFAGIGKATSYKVRIGGSDVVLVAVSAEKGEEIDTHLLDSLVKAIELYKDPAANFTVRSFKPRSFNIEARISISNDRQFENVKLAVDAALKSKFSFENRNFGQAVTISEVMSVIQEVDGVEAVDIEYLYEQKEDDDISVTVKKKEEIIRAIGVKDEDGVIIPSLLRINNEKIMLEEMQANG